MKRTKARPITYECGCMLSNRHEPDGRLVSVLCQQHQRVVIGLLSMNGRYVEYHNARGERLVVVAEPIALKS